MDDFLTQGIIWARVIFRLRSGDFFGCNLWSGRGHFFLYSDLLQLQDFDGALAVGRQQDIRVPLPTHAAHKQAGVFFGVLTLRSPKSKNSAGVA
jgi:hypothetical protein